MHVIFLRPKVSALGQIGVSEVLRLHGIQARKSAGIYFYSNY